MTSKQFHRLALLTTGAALLVLHGCTATSAPTKFYVLNALPNQGTEAQAAPIDQCLAIGVGPVELPEYLDREEIVTRVSANELNMAQFDQWAEPLQSNFSRVLAENLSVLLCTEPIAVFPWIGSTPIDYQITVEVTRFDGRLGGDADLVARWSIFRSDDNIALLTRKSGYSEPTGSSSYASLASAQSRALEALSRDIAEALETVLQK